MLTVGILGLFSACAAPPSPAERALLSVGGSRSAQVERDIQAIMDGMERARTDTRRVAAEVPGRAGQPVPMPTTR